MRAAPGTTCSSSTSAATPTMRRGSVLTSMNFMTGSVHDDMAVDSVLAGEHALRHALADDDDRLAALAVVVVEIAAGEDGNAEGGEKSGRDGAELRARIFFTGPATWPSPENWKPGPKLPASRQGTTVPSATLLDAGRAADPAMDFAIEVDDLVGRFAVRHDRNVDGEHAAGCRSRSRAPAAREAS